MKKLKAVLALVALFALTLGVSAQDSVVGSWTGTVQGGRGPQPVTLVLKMEAGKLAGALTGGRGGDVAITDAALTGSTLKFKSKQMGRGGEIVLNWTGTVKGDEMSMSRVAEGGQGQAQEFTIKRQK